MMQINSSLPLQFLNNPQPGTPAPDAGQNRQAEGNGVQNTAINPPTAVNPATQAQAGAPTKGAAQAGSVAASANTAAHARPVANQAAPSDSGKGTSSRLDTFA